MFLNKEDRKFADPMDSMICLNQMVQAIELFKSGNILNIYSIIV